MRKAGQLLKMRMSFDFPKRSAKRVMMESAFLKALECSLAAMAEAKREGVGWLTPSTQGSAATNEFDVHPLSEGVTFTHSGRTLSQNGVSQNGYGYVPGYIYIEIYTYVSWLLVEARKQIITF